MFARTRWMAVVASVALASACNAYDRDAYDALISDHDAGDASHANDATDVIGEIACTPPSMPCAGSCVTVATSTSNCGSCGHVCPGTTCVDGNCTNDCQFARLDCDGNAVNGCEVDASSDALHCGSCAHACAAGQSCVSGTCNGFVAGALGSPCTAHSDCAQGLQCNSESDGFPAGMCTVRCSGVSTDGCPTGSACDSSYGFCLPICTDGRCRDGYLCLATSSNASICTPPCDGNVATASPSCGAYICDAATHRCRTDCTADGMCSSGSICDPALRRCTCGDATVCGFGRTCQRGTCT